MLEETIRREVMRLMFTMGFDCMHIPDIRASESARPDLYCMQPIGQSFAIEVKRLEHRERVEPSLACSSISNAQRKWLDRWTLHRGGKAFLALGTVDPPRRLFIIPWRTWLVHEQKKGMEVHGFDGLYPQQELRMYISDILEFRDAPTGIQQGEIIGPLFEAEWITPKSDHFPDYSRWKLNERHPLIVDRNFAPQQMFADDSVEWPVVSYRFPEKTKEKK